MGGRETEDDDTPRASDTQTHTNAQRLGGGRIGMSLYLKELEGEMLEIAEVRVKYGARRLRRVCPDYFGEWPDYFGECKKSAIGRPGAAPGRPRAQKIPRRPERPQRTTY